MFQTITSEAQRLYVRNPVAATICERNNMIDCKRNLRLTFTAVQTAVVLGSLDSNPLSAGEGAFNAPLAGALGMAGCYSGFRMGFAIGHCAANYLFPVNLIMFRMGLLQACFAALGVFISGAVRASAVRFFVGCIVRAVSFAAAIFTPTGEAAFLTGIFAEFRKGFGLPALGAAFLRYSIHVSSFLLRAGQAGDVDASPGLLVPSLYHFGGAI